VLRPSTVEIDTLVHDGVLQPPADDPALSPVSSTV